MQDRLAGILLGTAVGAPWGFPRKGYLLVVVVGCYPVPGGTASCWDVA